MNTISLEKKQRIVVVMPALNEAATIGDVIRHIPRDFDRHRQVKILVVDDGSTDNTSEIARDAGADYVLKHPANMGVAAAIKNGMQVALSMGADAICTIDSDGQFNPIQIPLIVQPIFDDNVDMVIGSRFHGGNSLGGMSFIRLLGNIIVAKMMSKIIGFEITDAESGFRALSRRAALNLDLVGYFTFTHDMILDIWFRGLKFIEIPVMVQYFPNRKSRAVGNITKYSLGILSLLGMKFVRILVAMFLGHDIRRLGTRFGIYSD
ncbi:MAG: glycosyltransferase family 2 protein [Candidatus Thorarchaeota archaeon]